MENNFKIVFATICCFIITCASAQDWELKKSTKDLKAYTAIKEGSKVKAFKVVAIIQAPMECIYSVMTDYEHYDEIFKEIKQFEILKRDGDVLVTYALYGAPWPLQDRDLVAIKKITKTDDKITILTNAIKNSQAKKKKNVVRMPDYYEKCIIERIADKQTKYTITGHYDAGGNVPAWAQNMYVVDGSIDLVELIKTKCCK